TSVTNIETTDPEDDVLGNVGGVVGDAFKVAGGKNELEARAHQRGLFGHVQEELFKNAIAVLIDDIVAFEHLRGHSAVAEMQATVVNGTSPKQPIGWLMIDNFHFVNARSKRNHSPGRAEVRKFSRLTMASSARFIAPSTVWAMETR